MPHPRMPVSVEVGRPSRRRALRMLRRRRQRGATIFLVTLVMTLLTALGVFAARATSLSSRASGYVRQSEQTHYLLQHGMVLTLNEVTRGASVYGKRNPNNTVINQQCSTTAINANIKIPCVKFSTDWTKEDSFTSMVKRAQQQGGKPIVPPISMPPTVDPTLDPGKNFPSGSLGPALVLPSMYMELTDFAELDRPPPGVAVSGSGAQFRYRVATLVGWGQVGPYPLGGPTAACGSTAEKGAAMVVAREAGRGQIMFGPVD